MVACQIIETFAVILSLVIVKLINNARSASDYYKQLQQNGQTKEGTPQYFV